MRHRNKFFFLCFLLFSNVAWGEVFYTPNGGAKNAVDVFLPPTSSNYFFYDSGSVYMSHPGKKSGELKKIGYTSGGFVVEDVSGYLKEPASFSASVLNAIIDRDFDLWKQARKKISSENSAKVFLRSESVVGCGVASYYARPDVDGYGVDGYELIFPDGGVIDLGIDHVQYIGCDSGGKVVAGIIGCFARGCSQYLIGIVR